jgi:dihydroorotate dehydrogenase electron transfer subunit
MAHGMPVNLDVPLVSREPLPGPYALLTFEHPVVAREARAGQFVMIKAQAAAEPFLRRPFSIMATDQERGTFTLFLKAVGPGSRALVDMRIGELAGCLGPLGQPFELPPPGAEALLVAGGYGVAPFYMFGETLNALGRPFHVFYGGRSAPELPLAEILTERGDRLALATDDGSWGTHGRVTVPLESYLDTEAGLAVLYACGPDAMLHAVAKVAEGRGLMAQVSLDPWMGCGIGTCLGCVVRIQRPNDPRPKWRPACTEGPVFDARHVVWP